MTYLLAIALWFASSLTYADTLIIGTSADSPPFASLADGKNHFYGFEIDIMLEVCTRIQATCEFKPTLVSKLSDSILKGKINLAVAAIILPSSPLKGLIFSLPYYTSNGQFITLAQSSINNLEDLRNKKIGVRQGTLYKGNLFKDLILAMFDNQLNVIEYPNTSDLMLALTNGDVDADFSNEQTMKYWYTNNTNLFRLVGNKIPIGNGYAIMAKEGEEALIKNINHALINMESDGSYLKIYKRYF